MIDDNMIPNYVGNVCPNCSSENIRGAEFDPCGYDGAFRQIDCPDCNATWAEEFRLIGASNLELEAEYESIRGEEE